MKNRRIEGLVSLGLVVLLLGGAETRGAKPLDAVPDLTRGGKADDRHDWNLGPIGARGWMWGRRLETTNARQILITKVDAGSPADGVLADGDVILGAGGGAFTDDARQSFGRAIGQAESTGVLKLLRWRGGKQAAVEIKLPVLGAYAETAPFGCAKSRKIFEAGCRYIAGRPLKGGIDGKINALALLASGKAEYLPLVREYARKSAPADLELKLHGGGGMVSWSWGYANLFLTEYYHATGDKAVLPAIRKYAVRIAEGQSIVGSWGHGMAWPDVNGGRLHGSLGGYGALNQAGLVCHLSMILARKCGVKDPEVDRAIAKGNAFFGFYIGKGAIPYGDHRPGWQVHDDNGKNSIAAVLFDLDGHSAGARFFSRMTVASYGERERGHTGNYFSFLWGPLGANRAGAAAVAAFLKPQRWFYDIGRRADGSFPYQGGAGSAGSEHKYGNWDCTGAYILPCALPLRKLYITGKGLNADNELSGAELAGVVEAGRDFSSWHMGIEPYRAKTAEQLLNDLHSWSPAVRHRASAALAEKQGDFVKPLLAKLDGADMNGRYGACQALGAMKAKAAAAVPALTKTLSEQDLWLRIQATYALSNIGPAAKPAAPDLLKLAVRDDPGDPGQMTQRYVAFGLFYPGGALRMVGLLSKSVEGVDKQLLYAAIEKLLQNPDGRARGALGSVYDQLTYEQIKPILPAIHKAIVEQSPSGVMFASGIRLKGLELFAKLRIREGLPLCTQIMELDKWGKRSRISRCLNIVKLYGGAAKPIIPDLRKVEQQLLQHREAKGLAPQIEQVRQTIAYIENAKETPTLRSLDPSKD